MGCGDGNKKFDFGFRDVGFSGEQFRIMFSRSVGIIRVFKKYVFVVWGRGV